MPQYDFKAWLKSTFAAPFPLLYPCGERTALLYRSLNRFIIVPSLENPIALALFEARLSQDIRDDIEIAVKRKFWPDRLDRSDVGPLIEVYLRRTAD